MNLDGEEYKRLVEMAKECYGGLGLINSQMPDQLTRQARAFAEAIIGECIRIDILNWDSPPADAIRKHFGME